jgi:hypothetical protein
MECRISTGFMKATAYKSLHNLGCKLVRHNVNNNHILPRSVHGGGRGSRWYEIPREVLVRSKP